MRFCREDWFFMAGVMSGKSVSQQLITYGWAILAVLAIAALLALSGVFTPS